MRIRYFDLVPRFICAWLFFRRKSGRREKNWTGGCVLADAWHCFSLYLFSPVAVRYQVINEMLSRYDSQHIAGLAPGQSKRRNVNGSKFSFFLLPLSIAQSSFETPPCYADSC